VVVGAVAEEDMTIATVTGIATAMGTVMTMVAELLLLPLLLSL
jgi:hypothetical protein